jgi:aldehyde dehydrogenase (NAD+)
VNCGQTCIAPDYVLVHEEVAESFIDRLKEQIKHFYTDDPKTSGDYGRIISSRHLQRLVGLLKGVPDDAVVAGGASTADEEDRFLAPTLVLATSLPDDNKLLEEEIFGPILPIVTVPDIDAAIRIVNSKPKPLALYLFSSSKASQEQIMQRTTSGGCCINETLMHFACPALPFGGVGESGMGGAHVIYFIIALFICYSKF